MNDKELGPCPLCGWKATRHQRNSGVWCSNKDCDLKVALMSDANWNRLSALAAQNRRRGEALANAIPFIEFAGEEVEYAVGEAGIARILKLCKEALEDEDK